MAQRQIKRFVDVEIKKDTPRVSAAGFGLCLCVTDSPLLSTSRRVRRFTTPESVSNFFGALSEEYKASDALFFQDPFLAEQVDEMLFGRFADVATAALLECGDSPELDIEVWKLVTTGSLTVVIDGGDVDLTGLDFSSVTSLDDVASVIDAALAANGNCYFLLNRFNFDSPTTGATSLITLLTPEGTGVDISGSDYLDGDVIAGPSNLGGSIISQGQVAEDFAAAITAMESIQDDWYAMGILKKFRDDDVTEDMADEIESRRKMFLSATNDANTLVLGSTSTWSYYLKNANYKRSSAIYNNNVDLYPDFSWYGQQLPKDIGSTNWAFKTLAGIAQGAAANIPPSILSQSQIDAALDVNCNVYSETLSAAFTYFGTMGGGKNIDKEGEFIDIIRDIDFLQARTEEGLMSLFLEKDIIQFTNAGITIIDTRLKERLDQFGVKQGILVDGTVVTSFPKRSEVSQGDRDDRLLPDGTFTAELQGAIDTVIVRGTVFI